MVPNLNLGTVDGNAYPALIGLGFSRVICHTEYAAASASPTRSFRCGIRPGRRAGSS
jgi:hypothetical protein